MLVLAISADRKTADILEGNTGISTADNNVMRFRRRHPLPGKNPNFRFPSVDTMRDRSP